MKVIGKHYDILLALFAALLIISNIAATKLFAVGPLIFDGGAILFPITYILGDIFAEVYGLKRTKRAIYVAFGASALAALTFVAVQYLPGAADYTNQAAFEAVLGFVPRIVLASLAGFFCGQFINAVVLVKIKEKWGEKRLWIRLVSSTVAGELVDTTIFCSVAFLGVLSGWSFANYIIVGVVYKVAIEIIMLPVTYRVIRLLKSQETRP